jgi:ligand-binding SRPBCC domain-containing protein
MPLIELETLIRAPVERCFDLARSIDFHERTAAETQERAVAGRTKGLIELGEEVTFSARHFGVRQRLTSKITAFDRPWHFRDEMLRGAFAVLRHDHRFEARDDATLMRDEFYFEAPLGLLGRIAERAVLVRYMTEFLRVRAQILRDHAESDQWRAYLEAR